MTETMPLLEHRLNIATMMIGLLTSELVKERPGQRNDNVPSVGQGAIGVRLGSKNKAPEGDPAGALLFITAQ